MRCINCQSAFLPLLPKFKHKQQLKKTAEMLGLSRSGSGKTSKLLHSQHISSQVPLRTKAISSSSSSSSSSSLLLGVTSRATPGDISVFLQTSAGLFFLYWIANFVVPDIISKYLKVEQASEDQKPNDNTPMEADKANMPLNSTSMQQKKRGFNSRKPR